MSNKRWIPIAKELPEFKYGVSNIIWICFDGGVFEGYAWRDKQGSVIWWYPRESDEYLIEGVTHWMPYEVPDPPSDDEL